MIFPTAQKHRQLQTTPLDQCTTDGDLEVTGYDFFLDLVEVYDTTSSSWIDETTYNGPKPFKARYTVSFITTNRATGTSPDLSHWNLLFSSSCPSVVVTKENDVVTSSDIVCIDSSGTAYPITVSDNAEGGGTPCDISGTGNSDLNVAKCNTPNNSDQTGTMTFIVDGVWDANGADMIPQAKSGRFCSDQSCTLPGPSCVPDASVCGNNVKEGDETCDGTDPTPLYYPGTNNPVSCRASCNYCGDGNVNSNEHETCDVVLDPNTGAVTGYQDVNEGSISSCRDDCTYCGDGIIQSLHSEGCDPPNGSTCDTSCQVVDPNGCPCDAGTTIVTITAVPALEDINLQCDDTIEDPLEITASSTCAEATYTVLNPVQDGSGLDACGIGTIEQTWTTTPDCAGKTGTASRMITIVADTTPPMFDVKPADITIACDDPALVSLPTVGIMESQGTLTASDNCGRTVTITEPSSPVTIPGQGTCDYTIERTFQATDCSGNTASYTQTITVQDTVAPTLTVNTNPPNYECGSQVDFGTYRTAYPTTATDNCDASVTAIETGTSDSRQGRCSLGDYTRTWGATDCSGNAAQPVVQTFVVEDTQAPTLHPPADLTKECLKNDDFQDILDNNVPSATDTCDSSVDIQLTTTDDQRAGECLLGTYTRTWTATDCGLNTASGSQTITYEDTQVPTFTNVNSVTQECAALTSTSLSNLLANTLPTASDSCTDVNPVETSSSTTVSHCNGQLGTVERTWTASDCVHSTTAVQTVTLEDTVAPTVTVNDVTEECTATTAAGTLDDILGQYPASASDTCDPNISLGDVEDSRLGACGGDASGTGVNALGTVVRTWTATDCT